MRNLSGWMVVSAALLLAACGDGVPKVDDPKHIVIDGKPMSQADFIDTYCVKESGRKSPGCVAVMAEVYGAVKRDGPQ